MDTVVLDDLLVVAAGDQIVVDGLVVMSESLEVDESLLTGEADPVLKEHGDEVLSGSFVSSGSGVYKARQGRAPTPMPPNSPPRPSGSPWSVRSCAAGSTGSSTRSAG